MRESVYVLQCYGAGGCGGDFAQVTLNLTHGHTMSVRLGNPATSKNTAILSEDNHVLVIAYGGADQQQVERAECERAPDLYENRGAVLSICDYKHGTHPPGYDIYFHGGRGGKGVRFGNARAVGGGGGAAWSTGPGRDGENGSGGRSAQENTPGVSRVAQNGAPSDSDPNFGHGLAGGGCSGTTSSEPRRDNSQIDGCDGSLPIGWAKIEFLKAAENAKSIYD